MYQGNISRQGLLTGTSSGEFVAISGEMIALQYLVRLRTGSRSITIHVPDGAASWRAAVADDGGDCVTLPVGKVGRCVLPVEGRDADGW